jgi:hypothetical protein
MLGCDNSDYCSEAAERFAFVGLSTAKATLVIFAYFASLAKQAVNAQHILWARVTEESVQENLLTVYQNSLTH